MVGNNNLLLKDYKVLSNYKKEMHAELQSILDYWINYTIDDLNGGFYGSVSNNNIANGEAPKGIVLNSRILWAFSSSFLYSRNQQHLNIATRAFQYILHHFIDNEYDGVVWAVDYKGR